MDDLMTREAPAAQVLTRDFAIPESAINREARTVELAFSSEEPYERWFGTEILDHKSGSVRMDRMNAGAALLVDHRTSDQVGVVVKGWIGADRVGRALVRFSRSARGEEVFQDVMDGIRKLVSVGYRVHDMVLEQHTDQQDTYRVTDWEPYEVSIVAVPADPTVGVGRQFDPQAARPAANPQRSKEKAMEKDDVVTAPAPSQPVDVKVLTNQAMETERTRAREIIALGRLWNMADFATEHVNSGTPLEEFRRTLLEKLKDSKVIRPAESPEIGLSKKETERFSFLRALLAIKEPNNAEAQRAAAFEFECSTAARAKRGDLPKEREGGITIPTDVLRSPMDLPEAAAGEAVRSLVARLQQRDLLAGTTTAGGHTVATDLLGASFIELLRNNMVVNGLGTRMLRDLNGNVAIPSQTGGATAYWVAENGAATESEQTFGQATLSPKTVGAFTDYSRRLLVQSSIDVEAFVRMDLAMVLALAIDLAAINGSGSSNQPRGILNTSGIGSVAGGTNGLAAAWDHFVDLESAVANANAAVGSLHFLTNTKVRGKSRKTQQFSSTNGVDLWSAVSALYGAPAVSNQVPSNLTKGTSSGVCSAIIFGNFADLIIGMWGGLDLMLDPYTGATAGTRRIVALQDVDVTVRHAASFAAMVDALTA